MSLKIRRALLSVSEKSDLVPLAKALASAGAELVATGKTAEVLIQAGLTVIPIENLSGSPEAYQGRMKTLSFPVCSGILYRRNDPKDELDLRRLGHLPIDCVVVNFYPFEKTCAIEEIDIGGPTLVRAAAKNSPHVCVLTSPNQYAEVIHELEMSKVVSEKTCLKLSQAAWTLVTNYDEAISAVYGSKMALRYGENPHQTGELIEDPDSPIQWKGLTASALSMNNLLDLSAAYFLMTDLVHLSPGASSVVILKHNNPCGVAQVPGITAESQLMALEKAWEGDPVSAFGGVVLFSHALQEQTAQWLASRFVECVAAPELTALSSALLALLSKRKNLKAVQIRRYQKIDRPQKISIPGGTLLQSWDQGIDSDFQSVTDQKFPESLKKLAQFGCLVCRSLKSNAIAIVRQTADGVFQLLGAGQGQPNRIDALSLLAIPRAQAVLKDASLNGTLLISDAFFPFRDSVDSAAKAGIRYIVQPGGSVKDQESIQAANEAGVAMAFTGRRHFRHL